MKHLTYNPPFVIKIGERKFQRKYTLRGSIRALPDVCLLLETLSMYVCSIENEIIVSNHCLLFFISPLGMNCTSSNVGPGKYFISYILNMYAHNSIPCLPGVRYTQNIGVLIVHK